MSRLAAPEAEPLGTCGAVARPHTWEEHTTEDHGGTLDYPDHRDEVIATLQARISLLEGLLTRWSHAYGLRGNTPPDPHDPGECVDCDTVAALQSTITPIPASS